MTDATAGSRSVIIEREMPHPPEKIWRALTQRSLISQWLLEGDFEPVVGHRFTFRTVPKPGWNGVIACEVTVVEPFTRLAYSWQPFEGLSGVVSWTLTPTRNGTLVRMEQSGFRPDQTGAFKGASYGWQKMLVGLENVLARLD
jgi:uncharacterized protein YndB with AHSA1/START domain